jgi:hypothetical protein
LELHVSGAMYVGDRFKDLEYGSFNEKTFYNAGERRMTGEGFSLHTIVNESEDGRGITLDQQVLMRGKITYELKDKRVLATNESCAVLLLPNTIIESRDMTPEKASAWLDLYHLDTKILVDECIAQADDETEMVTNFRDMPPMPAQGRPELVEEFKDMLQRYITTHVEFEQYIPYATELFGPIRVYEGSKGEWKDVSKLGKEISLLNIYTAYVEVNEKTKAYEIWITGQLIEESKSEAKMVRIPITSIASIESGRGILRDV